MEIILINYLFLSTYVEIELNAIGGQLPLKIPYITLSLYFKGRAPILAYYKCFNSQKAMIIKYPLSVSCMRFCPHFKDMR